VTCARWHLAVVPGVGIVSRLTPQRNASRFSRLTEHVMAELQQQWGAVRRSGSGQQVLIRVDIKLFSVGSRDSNGTEHLQFENALPCCGF